MSQLIEVKVPDIGDFAEVPVIDLFVKAGDAIKVDDAIATLESDKATMDVPSTVDGVVKEVLIQIGSKVSEGVVLIKVEAGAAVTVNPENAPKTESTNQKTGNSSRIAISVARTIFSTVRAPHEPALTVGSLAMTIAGRPSTVPRPVTTPSAGRSGASELA